MILTDVTHAAVQAAIEANLGAFVCYCTQATGGQVHEDEQLTWAINGAPIPFLNGVVRTHLPTEGVDEAIETTMQLFKSRQQPMFWRVGPATRPAHLGGLLPAHGLHLAEEPPGMAVQLHALPESLPTPAHLVIERITNRALVPEWVQTFAAGFGFEAPPAEADFTDFFAAWLLGSAPGASAYLARLNGEPVATSFVFPAAGVAGIYAVGTVPSARRQGIGAAVTLAALQDARTLGYHIGILHSSAAGLNVYRRLGFQSYCTIQEYEWLPEDPAQPH